MRPDEFDTDIYAQEIEGLDKGKGFRTTGRGSIIHSSEVKNIIVPRLIVLLKLVIEEGVVSPDEVRAKLGLPDVEEAVEVEEDETTALQEEREAADQAVDEVVAQIAEAMGEDPGSYEPGDYGEDDEKIVQLKYWVTRLIDDYTGVKKKLRITVIRQEIQRPDSDLPVGGCPVRLKVEKGRWIAKIEDPIVCEPTIDKFAELGPEARRNLARHLMTDDPQQDSELAKMRRRPT